jgi:hypothetical protein
MSSSLYMMRSIHGSYSRTCSQFNSRFSQTKWNNFIMKESFFSARKAFPMRCYLFLIDFDLQYARDRPMQY